MTFEEFIKDRLTHPEFKKEWERLHNKKRNKKKKTTSKEITDK
jgi:hypothetical protein